jgi:predicted phosphoribosyltransferase
MAGQAKRSIARRHVHAAPLINLGHSPASTCDAEFAEIERRRERYLGNRERAEVAGRTAIVIDDGIATGATTRAALRATRIRNPKRLVLAVPVAPSDSLPELRREADDIVCLEDHPMLGAKRHGSATRQSRLA